MVSEIGEIIEQYGKTGRLSYFVGDYVEIRDKLLRETLTKKGIENSPITGRDIKEYLNHILPELIRELERRYQHYRELKGRQEGINLKNIST